MHFKVNVAEVQQLHKAQGACVRECLEGRKTQTFPVCAVGDLQGVDALGVLLVGRFLGDR